MDLKNRIILFMIVSSLALFVKAQEPLKRGELGDNPLRGIIYFGETSLDARVQTNGFNIGYNKGKIASYYRTDYFHLSFGYEWDHKEWSKTEYFKNFEGISHYTFGKQNYFMIFRAAKGRKIFLSEKALKRGIAVGYAFEYGADLGILKPYYLVLEYTNELEREFRSEAYSEENAHLFLDTRKILDKGSFFDGWDEMEIVPGIHGEVSAVFAPGAYEEKVRSLEVGLHLDVYARKIPVMVEPTYNSNSWLIPHFFIKIQLGKRYR